jgi:predicted transcriptional regulator
MASKTREITIVERSGAFNTIFKKFAGEKKDYDFEGVSALRRLLSNEKARLLHIIKTKKPSSIYELAKILKRDFKSVNDDIKLLERFGFIDMLAERTGKRNRLKPIIVVDSLNIKLSI